MFLLRAYYDTALRVGLCNYAITQCPCVQPKHIKTLVLFKAHEKLRDPSQRSSLSLERPSTRANWIATSLNYYSRYFFQSFRLFSGSENERSVAVDTQFK